MKTYTPEISIIVNFDDTPVRGNALVSGCDETDKACEDEIIARLDAGDVWAWACVEVKAEFRGVSASDYLGCCCYSDEEDFKAGGYYEDMVGEAISQLNDLISDLQGVRLVA